MNEWRTQQEIKGGNGSRQHLYWIPSKTNFYFKQKKSPEPQNINEKNLNNVCNFRSIVNNKIGNKYDLYTYKQWIKKAKK